MWLWAVACESMKSVMHSCFPFPATFNITLSTSPSSLAQSLSLNWYHIENSNWHLLMLLCLFFCILVNAETFYSHLMINFRFFFLFFFRCANISGGRHFVSTTTRYVSHYSFAHFKFDCNSLFHNFHSMGSWYWHEIKRERQEKKL